MDKQREAFTDEMPEHMMNHVRWCDDREEYVPIHPQFGFAATEINGLWDKFLSGWQACAQQHEAEIERLRVALNDLLNDCINFNGGELTDHIMKQASLALKEQSE